MCAQDNSVVLPEWDCKAPEIATTVSFTRPWKSFIQDPMKSNVLRWSLVPGAAAGMLMSCSTPPAKVGSAGGSGFAEARMVIEQNCVHCHGTQRLKTMPSFNDTLSLAALRGPGNWIVPGKPESSRFFQVVTLPDSHAGAMPPTGHAISREEISKLRAWITAGAPLPDAPVELKPEGMGPRSR
jgi:mono/diheme cytochrome c family protein